MPRSVQKINTLIRSEFEVYDFSNNPVLGLVTGDFDRLLSINGADSGIAITIAEVGDGRYSATFTPNATGFWNMCLRNSTYNPRGWSEGFDVTTDGVFDIFDIFTKADMVETGWDLQDTLRVMAAVLCGKVSGGPGTPAFTNLQQTATRVSAVADSSGNRTTVNLTP